MCLAAVAAWACDTSGAVGDSSGAEPDETTVEGDAVCHAPDPPARRALWVWHELDLDAHFDLLEAHAIDTVWVDAHEELAASPDTFEAYLLAATERCVEVELLLGASNAWALREGHADVLTRIDDVVAAAGAGWPALVGVHLDVEPHTLDVWDEDEASVAAQLVELFEATMDRVAGSGLRVSADIPFWYDGVAVPDAGGGPARPLSELAIDALDRVVVLAYRDHAAGDDGIIALAEAEVAYAAAVGGEVVVGVETQCGLEPQKITFCEEGTDALESALAEVAAALDGQPSFAGIAIHHHDTLAALGP